MTRDFLHPAKRLSRFRTRFERTMEVHASDRGLRRARDDSGGERNLREIIRRTIRYIRSTMNESLIGARRLGEWGNNVVSVFVVRV